MLDFSRGFEPQTRRTLKGKYRLLIFDGHSSHISNKVIEFCTDNDIILLCLPSHTTHILQPLDVGFFQPLSTAYRTHLDEFTTLEKGYSIDKTDFLRLIQMARKNAATETNIKHSWQKSGLFPVDSEGFLTKSFSIDPQVVLDRLGLKLPEPESRPTTPPVIESDNVPVTPTTAEQVGRIIQQIKAGDHNPILFDKIGKACNIALASNTLLRVTNDDLRKAQQRKEDRDNRGQAQCGDAQLMNLETVREREDRQVRKQRERQEKQQKRQDKQAERQLEQQFRSMCRLGPDIFTERRGGDGGSSPAKKKTLAPPTPGPLTSLIFDPPGPSELSKRQQSQRGESNNRVEKGGRAGRGGKSQKEPQEEVLHQEPARFSSRGRLIIAKKQ